MQHCAYVEMEYDQDHHWWFRGRKAIINMALKRFLEPNSHIAEIGCGMGGNLDLLKTYGEVVAIEPNPHAVQFVRSKYPNTNVIEGSLAELSKLNQKFDCICMFDVLEHIEDDIGALKLLATSLKPNGHILVTVPCYQFLFSKRDELLGHHRRYTFHEIYSKAKKAGLKISYSSHFMTLLMPIALLARFKEKFFSSADVNLHSYFLNRLFLSVFRLETFLLNRFHLPFGLSLMVKLEAE